MKIIDNPSNTVGISYWRAPRLLLIDLGRRSLEIAFALLLAFGLGAPLSAQQPAHNYRHRSTHTAIGPIARDRQGHILRSEAAKHHFETATGHPHGWPGHVVDHVVPLACGGADAPSNMQWQTIAAGKAKDRWERAGCVERRSVPHNPMGH